MTRQPNETLYEFITRLHVQGISGPRAVGMVRAAMTSPTELASALRTALTQGQASLLSFVLVLSSDIRDPALVPILCEIVDSAAGLGTEDAAEILGEIADPRAVPSLARTLLSPPEWDFDGYLGEKAVIALDEIGTPEARAAIRFAAESPRRRVWQATIRPMLERDRARLLVLAQRLVTEDPGSYHLEIVLPALAEIDTPEAWRIVESAAESDDDDNRAVAEELLRTRHRLRA